MPSQLPCEKCGKMTTYDGLIGTRTKLPCGHCGTPRPHTMRGATGCGGVIFMIFFVVAFLMVLINGDDSILIIFPKSGISVSAAYASNIFGILCVAVVKIFHVRQTREALIIEAETAGGADLDRTF